MPNNENNTAKEDGQVLFIEGGWDMKKLALLASLLLLIGTAAGAHEGAICLYADTGLNSCSADIVPPAQGGTGTAVLWLLYVRGDGVEMGKAAEFRVLCTSATVMFFAPTWEPYITLTSGTIPGNMTLSGDSNFGCGQDVVPLGNFTVFNSADVDTFYVKVVDNPTSVSGPGIYITDCSSQNNEVKVIGGTFVLTGDPVLWPANCNPAVETRSWGAIKDMYK